MFCGPRKAAKDAELLLLFPRARLRKYGYKLLKIICNSNEFTDFERRTEKCRIALRLLPFNSKTKWDGLMTAHFELGKCRKM